MLEVIIREIIMSEVKVQDRIKFSGDIKQLLSKVCLDYQLGNLTGFKIVEMGYEDFNIIVSAASGKYFIKIFADYRSDKESQEYVDRIVNCLDSGVKVPKLYKAFDKYLYMLELDNYKFRLAVMEFVDGKSYFESGEKVSTDEKKEIVRQAALLNKSNFKPPYVYDGWAIVNFIAEYDEKKDVIGAELPKAVDGLYEQFKNVRLDDLPHCYVHGDIMTTNVVKKQNGELYIVDFGCSNYYPRIAELAVLLCDIFYEKDKEKDAKNYGLLLSEYQKYIKLTDMELELLPLFRQVGFAMYILNGLYEKIALGNNSAENVYWTKLGMTGLAD